MSDNTRLLPPLGRLLIGGICLMSGLSKIGTYPVIVGAITAAGLPLASFGWGVAIAVEIGGGLALAAGYRTRPVAASLAFWCIVTAAFFHHDFADQNAMLNFLKNIMITGGLLQIVHFGAGALSLDGRGSATAARARA